MSKTKRFIERFVRPDGTSNPIVRYSLPPPYYYTSGDGIFRSDGSLGKAYNFFRYSKTLDLRKMSQALRACPNEDEKERIITIIRETHSSLTFEKSGNIVEYIQFFGKASVALKDDGIRKDIRDKICSNPCVNCGTTKDIQCDHKNDLKNDPRVLSLSTQTLDDFQPLCRHCNIVKREMKAKMMSSGKRFGATYLGFPIDFVSGDDTLNMDDPKWYVGTYWGDCVAFKREIYTMLTRS